MLYAHLGIFNYSKGTAVKIKMLLIAFEMLHHRFFKYKLHLGLGFIRVISSNPSNAGES